MQRIINRVSAGRAARLTNEPDRRTDRAADRRTRNQHLTSSISGAQQTRLPRHQSRHLYFIPIAEIIFTPTPSFLNASSIFLPLPSTPSCLSSAAVQRARGAACGPADYSRWQQPAVAPVLDSANAQHTAAAVPAAPTKFPRNTKWGAAAYARVVGIQRDLEGGKGGGVEHGWPHLVSDIRNLLLWIPQVGSSPAEQGCIRDCLRSKVPPVATVYASRPAYGV